MILYKYLPPDTARRVLRARRLRFTQPAAFNDPFEFRPVFAALFPPGDAEKYIDENYDKVIDELLAKQGTGAPSHVLAEVRSGLLRDRDGGKARAASMLQAAGPVILQSLREKFSSTMNDVSGVLCLSERRDSILMWGHYTDCHKGVVVGFDAEHPFFKAKRSPTDEFGFLRRVSYQLHRPQLTIMKTDSGLDPVRWTVGLRRLPLREHPLERGRADVADGRV